MFKKIVYILFGFIATGSAEDTLSTNKLGSPKNLLDPKQTTTNTTSIITPCVCGVFLSGQFTRGSPPKGNAVLTHEYDDHFVCNIFGNKQCMNKCLDVLVKHLANSPMIICGAIDRDCFRERAYLFIKNCNDKWINSNLSAGREFCCKNGTPYKCPLI